MNGLKLVFHDPVLGYVCNKNAHVVVNSPEFSVEYKINEYGYRDESPHLPSSTSLKILLVGDSFTFGAANLYEKIWPVVFEKQMKARGWDIEVIKAGVPFHNTDNSALYLERVLPKHNPDMVISVFVPNNLFVNMRVTDDGHSLTKRQRRKEDIIGMNTKFGSVHTLTLLKRLLISNDLLYTMIYMRTARAQFFVTPFNRTVIQQLDITKEFLSRMEAFCRDKSTPFVVLSIPQQFQILASSRGRTFQNIDVNCIDRTLGDFAIRKGFEWIPTLPLLSEAYRSTGENCFFRLDGHLTNEGNRLVGEYMAKWFAGRVHETGPSSPTGLSNVKQETRS